MKRERLRFVLPPVLIVGAVCAALGLLETGVRVVAPQPTKVSVPSILDPELIYRLPANARGTDVKEEFAVTIETNALGLRDRDFSREKPQGTVRRMLVLGDSMTFAEGVETGETYPKVLERVLATESGPDRYEVINAAIRGYGTDQEVVLFEKLFPLYRPDTVLLAFFAVNDFDDNVYGRLFDVQGDRLVRVPLSAESSPKYRYYQRQSAIQTFPGYRTLIAHSHLMNLIRDRWAKLEFRRTFQESAQTDPAREEQAWRLTAMLLERWIALARLHGVRPLLLLIPSKDQINRGHDEAVDARVDRVIGFARERKIPVGDPRQSMRLAAAGTEPVFYPKDGHLTAKGHRLVAEYLHRFLAQQGALAN